MNSRSRRLPLSGLRALDAFARCGRMTLAAEELGVTHGAVSRAIRSLERDAGVRLLTGATSRVELTPAGRRVAAAATQAFDALSAALDEERRHPDRLTISCPGTFAARWLIPRLSAFAAKHPGIEVHVREANGTSRLPERGCDAAIRMVEDEQFDTLTVVRFLANHHGPVLSPDLGRGKAADSAVRLHTRTYRPAWDDWQRDARRSLPEPRSQLEFDHIFHTLEAAMAGLGVAIAPWPYVHEDVAQGRLLAPFGFVRSRADYALVAPTGSTARPLAVFADWLIAEGSTLPAPPT